MPQVEPEGVPERPSVTAGGEALTTGIDGVVLERLQAHVDHRGSLTEVLDTRRPFWSEPVVYAYQITIAPGRIKGWGMHKLQTDRYFASRGSVRVVLYDGRVGSPTKGEFSQFHFSDRSPGLLAIPPGVWHADQNTGSGEAVIVNFPTEPYRHEDPDKHRLDPHGGEIPFDWALRDG